MSRTARLALAAVGVAASGAMGQMEMRAGCAAPAGEVSGVGFEGVAVQEVEGVTRVVSWDRVRRVGGEWEDEFASFEAVAEMAWRARTRLERGDALGAEPLFEDLFELYGGKRGATARVVCEGLLRCRLRRGAIVGAIEAWLGTLGAGGTGEWAREAGLAPVLDEDRGVVPGLPPMWVESSAVAVLATSGLSDEDGFARWYRRAAAFECGLEMGEMPPRGGRAAWVAEIVLARTGTAEERASGREALRSRMANASGGLPAWAEAWCRAAIGRSLILEEDEEQRLLGIVELLHVPSRLADANPYLAGLALAEASVALSDLGEAGGAARLAGELSERYPTHPALGWKRLTTAREATR